jgi:hypothetical protein
VIDYGYVAVRQQHRSAPDTWHLAHVMGDMGSGASVVLCGALPRKRLNNPKRVLKIERQLNGDQVQNVLNGVHEGCAACLEKYRMMHDEQ